MALLLIDEHDVSEESDVMAQTKGRGETIKAWVFLRQGPYP